MTYEIRYNIDRVPNELLIMMGISEFTDNSELKIITMIALISRFVYNTGTEVYEDDMDKVSKWLTLYVTKLGLTLIGENIREQAELDNLFFNEEQ